ncbi:MAG: acetylornithine deacetylase [Pseudomonadota bacterium]
MTETLRLLDRLIAFETVSAQSNLALIDFVSGYLSERGFHLTRLADTSGEKAGLFATTKPGDGGVLLSAHSDVVPASGQAWTRPPFQLTRDADRVFGRGTTDMKGYLAAMLAAADRASRQKLSAPLALAISYDEEVGCLGIAQMIDHMIPAIGRPRLAIIGEPTEMAVAVGHKGKVALQANCRGIGGHSALAPRFVNALHIAADFVAGLRAMQDALAGGPCDPGYDVPYSTLHVGRLSGGAALNIVPDSAELLFEARVLPGEDIAALLMQIEALAQRVSEPYRNGGAPVGIQLREMNRYPGLDTAPDAAFVGAVQGWAQQSGTTKVAFGTEAGFFDQLGIPSVVCGPGSMASDGHKPDESLALAQLAACDAMMDRLLQHLA